MSAREACPDGCGMLADECECPSPWPLAGFDVTPSRGSRRQAFPIEARDDLTRFAGLGAVIARGFRESA